jgi:glyceraldehyde 3-phosphate dehydrogenase
MAMISVQFGREVSTEELNELLRETALHSRLQQQIGYTISDEAVSSDFVGSRRACVVDSRATITNGDMAVVYCWYDNEFGYSCQVVRTLEKMAGVEWRIYPHEG